MMSAATCADGSHPIPLPTEVAHFGLLPYRDAIRNDRNCGGYAMKRLAVILMTSGLALGGCAALQRDTVQNTENNLAAAGFTVLPATTPARVTMLTALPPNRVSRRIDGEHVSYLYPDTVVCHCLYVGSQAAWGRYLAAAQAQRIARDQLDAAEFNNQYYWDWGPWGGYDPRFY
jgi:hypothetical protein